MKERLERRRKLKEKQHATEIKNEQAEAEKQLDDEYDKKTADFIERNKAEKQEKIDEALQNPDYQAQREGIRAIEKEQDQLKKDGLANLEI